MKKIMLLMLVLCISISTVFSEGICIITDYYKKTSIAEWMWCLSQPPFTEGNGYERCINIATFIYNIPITDCMYTKTDKEWTGEKLLDAFGEGKGKVLFPYIKENGFVFLTFERANIIIAYDDD